MRPAVSSLPPHRRLAWVWAFWSSLGALGCSPAPSKLSEERARPQPGLGAQLRFSQDLVAFDLPPGELEWRELSVQGAEANHVQLRLVSPAPDHLEVQVNGAHLRIGSCQAPPGVHVGNLRFASGLDSPQELLLPYSCRVRGTLLVEPSNPYLNLRSDSMSLIVRVRSSAPAFEVTRCEITRGEFSARVLPRDTTSIPIELTVLQRALTSQTRGLAGQLRIHSNDPYEPIKDVPILAFGKPAL